MKISVSGKLLKRAGFALILAALLLAGYNIYDDMRAGRSVFSALSQFPEISASEEAGSSGLIEEETIPDYMLYPEMDMPTVKIDGNEYIGILEIPSAEKRLPVLSKFSMTNLKIAPCRYAGSAYTDDLVICAHNYRSHFGGMGKVRPGDAVVFTDASGNVFNYQIFEVEQVDPDDPEYMLYSDYDLTLFTCTLGGQMRTAYRCMKWIKEE